jgi:segregation and condensation protein A
MFLAVLELLKLGRMHVRQDETYGSIVLISGKAKYTGAEQIEMDTEGK